MICISQDTRLKQKVRSPSFGILKQTLWSRSNASQILFIDPKSNLLEHSDSFQNHCWRFPWYEPFSRSRKLEKYNQIYITMTCSPMFLIYLISLTLYFNQRRRSLPLNADTFSSFFLVPLYTVYNQIWQNNIIIWLQAYWERGSQ